MSLMVKKKTMKENKVDLKKEFKEKYELELQIISPLA